MFEKESDFVWKYAKQDTMKVPARVIANETIKNGMLRDRMLQQIKNVASLPGIVKNALVMPDGHEGYGFPIGGVAAFDHDGILGDAGIISPGGIGYDINCGVRLVKTPLTYDQIQSKIKDLIKVMHHKIPCGVGCKSNLRLTNDDLTEVLVNGVNWAVDNGYGIKEDLMFCEENGKMVGASVDNISDRAMKRGRPQLGTLGAGNHFLEIQKVENVKDSDIAKQFGLFENQAVIMIHTGSRGFGHQVCDDYLRQMLDYDTKNNLPLPDKELCYAPIDSELGQSYFASMKAATNYAFTNRHIIMHWVRESFESVFPDTKNQMPLLYDVAHNIAKIENHDVQMEDTTNNMKLIVHRKGATRAFPAGRPELPEIYQNVGQPVLIPGSMGTASYVLVGKQKGLDLTFGSTCHGAGRVMSRSQAKNEYPWQDVKQQMQDQGIELWAAHQKVISEEAPGAYKDVDQVIDSVVNAGISDIVVKLVPVGVVKG